ncbi:MAG: hypothetical protein Q8O56_16680 [Solirubrobacteraceae bacterium]|nr:hypothetical protein [Solirubrobacteraceae bacterium]
MAALGTPARQRICEPAGFMLDRLRAVFPIALAIVLPLAGIIIAGARYADGDRDEALRMAAASLVGGAIYWLLLG